VAGWLACDAGPDWFDWFESATGDAVISKIWVMMSAFLFRAEAFRPRALAIAKSWSLSLDSSWDCSSACAATLTYFARENAKGESRDPEHHA
jgi:hypothetical protein